MGDVQAKSDVRTHLFETPNAERFFKALLWAVLILQILVFAKAYQRLIRHMPERPSATAWR